MIQRTQVARRADRERGVRRAVAPRDGHLPRIILARIGKRSQTERFRRTFIRRLVLRCRYHRCHVADGVGEGRFGPGADVVGGGDRDGHRTEGAVGRADRPTPGAQGVVPGNRPDICRDGDRAVALRVRERAGVGRVAPFIGSNHPFVRSNDRRLILDLVGPHVELGDAIAITFVGAWIAVQVEQRRSDVRPRVNGWRARLQVQIAVGRIDE